ncbi:MULTISPECIES: hypothetical protein [Psychrobacter]|uniref:Lipoprotein n=1 Tax=Psychrobacter fozii TaxID=198480 RepID=A0A2V4V4P0_9GAMM|nr:MULTISPECIES: hypothetical protein [Psychrobacter]MBH0063914.1 hypothetical protein [Psychrobacter sp. SZ93C1]PYE40911.1 hypothetical protein DFP82_101227 [Psychrobacter fozii]
MKKTVLNTALSSAFIVAFSFGVSACGGEEHEEVMAVDRVDEAAALAIENAPEAEDMKFPETAAMPAADAAATEADGTATAEEGTDATAMVETATTAEADSADADAAATDSAEPEAAAAE